MGATQQHTSGQRTNSARGICAGLLTLALTACSLISPDHPSPDAENGQGSNTGPESVAPEVEPELTARDRRSAIA